MTLVDQNSPSTITLKGSNFLANGHPFLTEVPSNITATPSPFLYSKSTEAAKMMNTVGCFVGFDANEPKDRHVIPLGKLRGIRFMSIFRFKVWWTTHWTGTNGHEMEHETQMMILDKNELIGRPYVLLLPIIEGSFRSSLQPGFDDHVDICVESGSTCVRESSFRSCLYIHAGDDPFRLVKDAIEVMSWHEFSYIHAHILLISFSLYFSSFFTILLYHKSIISYVSYLSTMSGGFSLNFYFYN